MDHSSCEAADILGAGRWDFLHVTFRDREQEKREQLLRTRVRFVSAEGPISISNVPGNGE